MGFFGVHIRLCSESSGFEGKLRIVFVYSIATVLLMHNTSVIVTGVLCSNYCVLKTDLLFTSCNQT